jgi:hypothetical protein
MLSKTLLIHQRFHVFLQEAQVKAGPSQPAPVDLPGNDLAILLELPKAEEKHMQRPHLHSCLLVYNYTTITVVFFGGLPIL